MGRKLAAILGSGAFLIIAPGFVAGLVPYWISRWRFDVGLGSRFLHSPTAVIADLMICRIAATILLAFGLFVLLECFARFALKGLGTPAPVFPPQHLVVTGFYLRTQSDVRRCAQSDRRARITLLKSARP